jgi:hypothetical protein
MAHDTVTIDMLRDMLVRLKQAGFTGKFEITYDGSGDSGDIHEPTLEPSLKGAIHGLGFYLDEDAAIECIDRLLPGGWEINEGSSGSVVFDIDTGKIMVCHNENVMTTDYNEWEV